MGKDADEVFDALSLSDADKKNCTEVTAGLEGYFVPTVNIIHFCTLFEQTTQHPGETVEFVRRLRAAAKNCKFDKLEERIRDRFVAHITNREVSKQLQLRDHDHLMLVDAVSLALQTESVSLQVRQQKQPAKLAGGLEDHSQPGATNAGRA